MKEKDICSLFRNFILIFFNVFVFVRLCLKSYLQLFVFGQEKKLEN